MFVNARLPANNILCRLSLFGSDAADFIASMIGATARSLPTPPNRMIAWSRISSSVRAVIKPRQRNLWVTDTLQWTPEDRLAQSARDVWIARLQLFAVRSLLPFEPVCHCGKRYGVDDGLQSAGPVLSVGSDTATPGEQARIIGVKDAPRMPFLAGTRWRHGTPSQHPGCLERQLRAGQRLGSEEFVCPTRHHASPGLPCLE